MTILLALVASLLAAPSHAIHETVFAANAADSANNRLLANPPLPMLRYSPGKWKLGLTPYYFTAEEDFVDSSPSGSFRQAGDYAGWGLGGSASWAFAERWGLFVLGVGSRVSGEDLSYTPASGNPAANSLVLSDAGAGSIALAGGIVYQFFGRSEEGFVLPVFAGPLLKKYDYSHRVVERLGNGSLNADYDVEGSGVVPGILVGAQAGINLGSKWQLNPFVILGLLMNDEVDARVSTVRFNAFPNDPQQGVNRLQAGEKPDGNSEIGGVGLNVVYRPWSLSVNVSSPLLSSLTDSELEMQLFSLSWAFGDFSR